MTIRKRAILTLSVTKKHRQALAGALYLLQDHTSYANISAFIIGLIEEADHKRYIVPVVSQSDLERLKMVFSSVKKKTVMRDVLAISIPLDKQEVVHKVISRVHERSGQRSISALVVNLILDKAIHMEELYSVASPNFNKSSISISMESLQELIDLYYSGHITTAEQLAETLTNQLSTDSTTEKLTKKILAESLQRIALILSEKQGNLEVAHSMLTKAINVAREIPDVPTKANVLLSALYRRAGIILQIWRQVGSSVPRNMVLENAHQDLIEAYSLGTNARHGLREEAGLRLALVLTLLGESIEKISPYFDTALVLFAKAPNMVIEDESGIIISRAGILHQRAQLSILLSQRTPPSTSEIFSLNIAFKDITEALKLLKRTDFRWRIDMQLTRAEIFLSQHDYDQAELELARLTTYVHQLRSARIENRYNDLQALLQSQADEDIFEK